MSVRIMQGHVLDRLAELPEESVHCIVTSPPYWGLRDYGIEPQVWGGGPACDHQWLDELLARQRSGGTASSTLGEASGGHAISDEARLRSIERQMHGGQSSTFCPCGAWRGSLGLEPTYQLYIDHMVAVFRAVRRVLRQDGTVWLNLGDSYATGAGAVGARPGGGDQGDRWTGPQTQPNRMPQPNLKPKDLVGIPWRVAFALQEDGWWLRSDIIWSKPNPMPESVTDRPTKAHEYLFLLSKSERYYYDAAAIAEKSITNDPRTPYTSEGAWQIDGRPVEQRHGGERRKGIGAKGNAKTFRGGVYTNNHAFFNSEPMARNSHGNQNNETLSRNRRSVWSIATAPYSDAHFATFPPALVEPCILAGCPIDGTVLDPFGGAGTVGLVADRLGRSAVLIELNPDYAAMARRRIEADAPLFAEVAE